ncbi:MAG: DUF2231 domain-containing protein [Dehalococcoidia bacterium]
MLGIEKVAGLPLHVLIVHFAVVLVPLAAVSLIATGWRADWRRRYGLAIALIAIVGAASAFVAAQSGASLAHTVRQSAAASNQQTVNSGGGRVSLGEHPEQGDNAEVAAITFAVAAALLFGLEQWGDRIQIVGPEVARWLPMAAYIAASGLGAVALFTMIVAGHSGATLVWKDVGNFVSSN